MADNDPNCWSCQHLQGTRTLHFAPRIWQGVYWNVEHVPETSIPGWVVLVLRRHAAALHDLTDAEHAELGVLTRECVRALHAVLDTEKEYLMQFAESEHFRHVHVHLVPRGHDWPDALRGPGVFAAHGKVEGMLTLEQVTDVCEKLRGELAEAMGE